MKLSGKKQRVVILGGGFGGMYAFRSFVHHLKKYGIKPEAVDITIVNTTNYFLFTPLLHEVATGGLQHHLVVESLRELTYRQGADVLVAQAQSVDLEQQKVVTTEGELEYDWLVIATGAGTAFYGTAGAKEHCYTLKALSDAIRLRTRFIDIFEQASRIASPDERKRALSFVIVGGGPTGVELAAETMELFTFTFTKYYAEILNCDEISLTLVHRGKELLLHFPKSLRGKTLDTLQKKGVQVLLETGVEEVTEDGVKLSDGNFLEASTVIWTAGVTPNTLQFEQPVETVSPGRIATDNTLRLRQFRNVFALGDTAAVPSGKEGEYLQTHAQVAVQEGQYTGKSLAKIIQTMAVNQKKLSPTQCATPVNVNLAPFQYKNKGDLVSLGQWKAVGQLFGWLNISGPVAWWIWRTIYLFKFISPSKRFKIAMDWTLNLLYHRDTTRA